jgi:hypothetical protein
MAHEFVIKNGFISKGDSIVSGSLSGETLNLTTTPSNDNSQTQVLVRNNTTGLVEYRDASTFSGASDTNTFVTGFTYNNNNTFTISDNLGSAFTATINQVSGLTVNGKVITTQLQVTSSPTSGYVLTSDASGNATWQAAGGGTTLRNVGTTSTFATDNETINCTGNTFTVNLPTAVGIQGTTYTLVNSGTGVITLDANGTETINGSLTIDLSTQYISRTVQSDGANWIVI